MAGMSTFMKAVSIAYYLAQMGFPVPVAKMTFTPVDGIFTSINVPDDISQGYSHFYAEVLRVKGIAEKVAEGLNLFIIFDELFKGTNVKDAYDATLAVTDAYASHRNCLYIISTHIVEVGPALSEKCGNVQFRFLSAQMDGNRLVYPYKLADGISADRHGMTIIMNERILETIAGETENEM
jgi:DNA mismatch repair ATPase MutS